MDMFYEQTNHTLENCSGFAFVIMGPLDLVIQLITE